MSRIKIRNKKGFALAVRGVRSDPEETHFVREVSRDACDVLTACGLDGWSNDGASQRYHLRGENKLFRAAFELFSVTCPRCLLACKSVAERPAAVVTQPGQDQGLLAVTNKSRGEPERYSAAASVSRSQG